MDDVRLENYKTMIKDINQYITRQSFPDISICNNKKIKDTPLALIYDYNKCNDYAKVIMSGAKFFFSGAEFSYNICGIYRYYDDFKSAKKTADTAMKFVNICAARKNAVERYKFIFWALMILTVDKVDAEEHLSLICDYAKLFHISDDEFEDIIQIVKIICGEEKPHFITKKIPSIFQINI